MKESARRESRFDAQRQRTRTALLEAAHQLFREKGVRATKLEEICARAEVAPRTLFNHFRTREHLYEAIASERSALVADLIDAAARDPRPFRASVTEVFGTIARYLVAQPRYRELVGEMLHLRIDGEGGLHRSGLLGGAVLRLVEEAVVRGQVVRSHEPGVLADLLLGALNTALANWIASEDYDLEAGLGAAARALADLFEPACRS